jgi:uncharacterized protein
MKEAVRLRIYVGENDRWGSLPLYEAIVLKARELGLAGATVTRGLMGYGASSRLHTAKILRLSTDLPVVVEVIDSEDWIGRLLESLEGAVGESGLITREKVLILHDGPGRPASER